MPTISMSFKGQNLAYKNTILYMKEEPTISALIKNKNKKTMEDQTEPLFHRWISLEKDNQERNVHIISIKFTEAI